MALLSGLPDLGKRPTHWAFTDNERILPPAVAGHLADQVGSTPMCLKAISGLGEPDVDTDGLPSTA